MLQWICCWHCHVVCPILVCSVSVLPRCYTLRCYSYNTNKDGFPQSHHAVTCDHRQTSCLTVTTIMHGEITSRQYSCWLVFNSSCPTVASQKNETYIYVQNCCQGDLCNDGNIGREFESGKKYCYAASCSGENCLSKLQKVIDRENLGTFCSQDGEDCYTRRNKLVNTEGRKITHPGIEFDFTQPEYDTGCT